MSIPCRAEIIEVFTGRNLSSIHPDFSWTPFLLPELQNSGFRYQNFVEIVSGIQDYSWNPFRVARKCRIVGVGWIRGGGRVRITTTGGSILLHSGQACRGQFWCL